MKYWDLNFAGDIDTARRNLMTNCALGLTGEATEISDLPSSDEIGDGFWYAYVLLWTLNIEGYKLTPSTDQDPLKDAFYFSGKISELIKKHVFHGREFDVVSDPLIRATKRYIDSIAGLDSQTPEESYKQNIEKLKARYPEGFIERG